jgi:hypothetical protein
LVAAGQQALEKKSQDLIFGPVAVVVVRPPLERNQPKMERRPPLLLLTQRPSVVLVELEGH